MAKSSQVANGNYKVAKGKQADRTKSEKVKAGYVKRIKLTLVLRRKKLFENIKNSGELVLTQEIGRTEGNSADSRKNRETWIICDLVPRAILKN